MVSLEWTLRLIFERLKLRLQCLSVGFIFFIIRTPNIDICTDTLRRCIRPTADYKITPLKSRDVLPDTKQVHQLELTYEVKVAEGDSTITPQFPRMNEVLYESTFENFCCIVFDAQKRSLSYQVRISFALP